MVNLGFFNEERYDMNCPKFNFNEVHHDSHVRDHRSILEVTQGIGTHLCVVCARSGFPSARINDFARYPSTDSLLPVKLCGEGHSSNLLLATVLTQNRSKQTW